LQDLDPEQIRLFGSRAEGRHRPDSDFDLFVVAGTSSGESGHDYYAVIDSRDRFSIKTITSQTGRMWPMKRNSPMAKKLPPIHPGEILREEFLVPLKLTPYAVAAALDVPRTRIERIAREEKPVTADTALRLGKFFKTGAAFWMNIQARFDLETAEDVLAPQIKKIASYEAL
jgi:addiction module HigA family antidote